MDSVIDDMLILLADILGAVDRVLAHAAPHDPRLARIRALAVQLENAVLEHWADAESRTLDDDRSDDLPF